MTGTVKKVDVGGGMLNCYTTDEHREERVKEGNEAGTVVLANLAAQLQQQQQRTSVRWEKFLPVRTLKVLLVESDDSTRQVVSALLRNCSYEVTAAANGLQAWKILEDLTNHIDLVLTEVVMPCLSGIGLLRKIMNHKTCKNMPVIMTSSNDSMGIVFKCLSKGAVDFLVKPIRKNELKNLWQHVWRSHSSSRSGSESGIQTQKSVKSKSGNASDNNTGSNDDDDWSIGLDVRGGSDNGSGTQSSWEKHAVEVDGPQPTCPSDQLADSPDSTCAQVIHPKIGLVPTNRNRGCRGQKEVDDDSMGKDLEMGVPGNLGTQHGSNLTKKTSNKLISGIVENWPESNLRNENAEGPKSSNVSDKPTQVADLIGTMTNSIDLHLSNRDNELSNEFSKELENKDSSIDGPMEFTSLQLSLKRLRSTSDDRTATYDDRNTFRHSGFSALSRYYTSAASMQAPAGHGGSCCPLDNSSEAVKTESSQNTKSNPNTAVLSLGNSSSRDNNDMGSSTKKNFTKQINPAHTSAFHPLQPRTSILRVTKDRIDDMKEATDIGKLGAIQHQVQVQYSHHHCHHHHHVDRMKQLQVPLEQNGLSLKSLEASPYCGSSNMLGGMLEGNAANCSLHGSNSGSNDGSNGQIGSSAAVNTEGENVETVHGTGGSNRNASSSGVAQNRFAQREAALNKFRQKRKERNFQNQVRYHSRKKLAEERPRVRGQFVRRTAIHEDNKLVSTI